MPIGPEALSWWQRGAIYQVYVRSFQDSNADGIGDLAGVARRLDYLVDLGVDAIWLNPFFPSPMQDFGYDVADYCGVDPQYGTMADFDHLLSQAHARGIKVILDLVVNHTSDQHPWFLEACRGRRSPKRDWYVWRDPAPGGGPPNNWRSFFGGPAWTFDPATQQYYLHHFLPDQPDLNYRNPEVLEAMLEVMRFWLGRGVDGFRLDALTVLVEDAHFRSEPENPLWKPGGWERERLIPCYTDDQPETHAIVHAMRRVADAYQTRVLIGETYLPHDRLIAYHGLPDALECHMPFNFHLITDALDRWSGSAVRRVVEDYEAALPAWGWPNWVLGNHDQPRFASRLSEAQARVAAMLLLTLRGTPTWYYGDEIGMLNGEIPPDRVQDPAGLRQPDVPNAGRDPERTPMQWDASPYAGFSTVEPWLPVNPDYPERNVHRQSANRYSMLNLVKSLLRLRRESPALVAGAYETVDAPQGVYAYARTRGKEQILVALNFTAQPRVLTTYKGRVLLSTHPDREGRQTGPLQLRENEGLVVKLSV